MASLARLTPETYEVIAEKLTRFSSVFGPSFQTFTLEEAFPVWTVRPDKWTSDAFYDTHRWHFQVKRAGIPFGYIYAKRGNIPGDWEVVGAFNSQVLAQGVENAMIIADGSERRLHGRARLVDIPYYQVTALWIHHSNMLEDHFIFAYRPVVMNTNEALVLSMEQFFNSVREMPLIQGREYGNNRGGQ